MLKGSKCFTQKKMHCEPICVFLKSSCILRKKSLLRQSICASLPRLDDIKMKWSFLFRDLRCHRSWQESSKSACFNLFSLTFSNCSITDVGIWNQVKKIHVLTNAKCRYRFTRFEVMDPLTARAQNRFLSPTDQNGGHADKRKKEVLSSRALERMSKTSKGYTG